MQEDDYTIQYEGFKLACDPKSLLYLFGMRLDYRWGFLIEAVVEQYCTFAVYGVSSVEAVHRMRQQLMQSVLGNQQDGGVAATPGYSAFIIVMPTARVIILMPTVWMQVLQIQLVQGQEAHICHVLSCASLISPTKCHHN